MNKYFVIMWSTVLCVVFCIEGAQTPEDRSQRPGACLALERAFRESEIYAVLKTPSPPSSLSEAEEEDKDTHAEREVSSGGSGSEAAHVQQRRRHSLTPPPLNFGIRLRG